MRRHQVIAALLPAALACGTLAAAARPFTDPRGEVNERIDQATAAGPRDPACHVRQLVAAGGPAPRDRHTLAVRWIGYGNFELAYAGQVILLDAYYDRGSEFMPLGVAAADITRANLLLLGHGHFDHMSDAASIGARTGATVIGAPITTQTLARQPIPPEQVRTVTGTTPGHETLNFGVFTVEPILARHGEPGKHLTEVMETALAQLMPAPTPAQEDEAKRIAARGTFSPAVIDAGTITYVITFDTGFRVLYRDSGGVVTEAEKAAMARIGRVDLALTPVSADYVNPLMVNQALEYLRTYRPAVIMPDHHDAPLTMGHVPQWRATEPLFEAMKAEAPDLVTISRQYREPTCFDTGFNLQHGD